MKKYVLILLFLFLFQPIVSYGFYIEKADEPILRIPVEKLNSYRNEPLFVDNFKIESNIGFISFEAWNDEDYIYLPAQAYFESDPHCCPTSLVIIVKRKSFELAYVEIWSDYQGWRKRTTLKENHAPVKATKVSESALEPAPSGYAINFVDRVVKYDNQVVFDLSDFDVENDWNYSLECTKDLFSGERIATHKVGNDDRLTTESCGYNKYNKVDALNGDDMQAVLWKFKGVDTVYMFLSKSAGKFVDYTAIGFEAGKVVYRKDVDFTGEIVRYVGDDKCGTLIVEGDEALFSSCKTQTNR